MKPTKSRRYLANGTRSAVLAILVLFGTSLYQAAKAEETNAPVITEQPQSVMVAAGDTLRLSSVVTGSTPIACIWRKGAAYLGNQTNATLVIPNVQLADSGR